MYFILRLKYIDSLLSLLVPVLWVLFQGLSRRVLSMAIQAILDFRQSYILSQKSYSGISPGKGVKILPEMAEGNA